MAALEVVAALTRRSHVGDLTLQERNDAANEVRQDCSTYLVVNVTDESIEGAIELALKHNLRAFDAAQLASALIVRDVLSLNPAHRGPTLVSADRELNSAATLEGLEVDDPNNH